MYKVLIADDEDIICRGLASMVSRHTELEVVALAGDGEIAFEKAKETQPDLMFVDINMPFLNGLEFIEKIRDILPDVVIIVVSGYDDFEYVQKALQLGVADYLLKPVMEEPFYEVLDKAVSRLDSMDKSRKFMNWVEGQVEQNRPIMVNDFLSNWLSGQMEEIEIEDQMRYLRIQMPLPYQITIIHPYRDYEKDSLQYSTDRNEEVLYFGCCSVVQKCFEPYSEAIYFRTEDDSLAVISNVLLQQQWEQLMQELTATMEECLGAKMELVQQQGDSIAEFPRIFGQLMEVYKDRKHYSDAVLQAMSMINAQWGNSELSLQLVADSLFVSASYLSRLFRRETGENFAACLTRKRINEAMMLLINTNMKMYEIAQKTGYTSQHYFSNAFKKAMGISPTDYRKNVLK